jgi:glycine cleavage system H protein
VGNIARELNAPSDIKYTKTHEWVRAEGDVATVGITDHAQSELGDIVFVELPEVGRVLSQGDTFGTVESVKTVSDVYSPVSGEVVETNPALGAQSELVNTDPYGGGWMVKLKLSDPGQLGGLLGADAYNASLND